MANVLFVEDSENIAQRIIRGVSAENHRVMHCATGENALEILESGHHTFDLIILTNELPKLDGTGVLRRLRQDKRLSKLAVVFVNGFADEGPIHEPVWTRGYEDKYVNMTKTLHTQHFPGQTVDELIQYVDAILKNQDEGKKEVRPMSKTVKILVVEDDERTNQLIKSQLENADFDVTQAFDGEQAIDLLSCQKFDGVTLDLNMPKKNGSQVLNWIRRHADDRLKNIEVVIITSDSTLQTGSHSPHTFIMTNPDLHDLPNYFRKVLVL